MIGKKKLLVKLQWNVTKGRAGLTSTRPFCSLFFMLSLSSAILWPSSITLWPRGDCKRQTKRTGKLFKSQLCYLQTLWTWTVHLTSLSFILIYNNILMIFWSSIVSISQHETNDMKSLIFHINQKFQLHCPWKS